MFVVDDQNQVQGFLGWALTSKEKAEAWVEGRGGLSFEDSREGDCLIFNAWAASSLKISGLQSFGVEQVLLKSYGKQRTMTPAVRSATSSSITASARYQSRLG
jgi:hypothetical protein